MNQSVHISTSISHIVLSRINAYNQLAKTRLSLLVVFSSIMAYLFESATFSWMSIFVLGLGGFLVTASSNTINQILEKETDKLMNRTMNRPLPSGNLTIIEATIFAGLTGVIGIGLLSFYFNPLSGLLAALSLLIYAFIYTPFKRISPAAVFIGAVPGALPLLIGSTVATGHITLAGFVLFTIQFMWQMPHFWAIAWLLNDDYSRAGFSLLPSGKGKSRDAALQILPYNILLIISSVLPYAFGIAGSLSLVISLICGFLFMYTAVQLCIDLSDKSAKKLMFASFFYIPIVQISLVLDKI